MHEVGDDQRRLDNRNAHQDDQHVNDRQMFVAKKNFKAGQPQQPNPNGNKQSITSGEMLVNWHHIRTHLRFSEGGKIS